DSTISTRSRPSRPSSDWPTSSPESGGTRVARRRASSPEIAGPMKPRLVPGGGRTEQLGASVTAEGVNFAVYSETASALCVSVFDELDREAHRFELDVHEANIHAGLVAGLGAGTRYGLRADGRYDPD